MVKQASWASTHRREVRQFFCNQEQKAEFYDDLATNLVNWESDHYPILMEVKERQSLIYEKKKLSLDFIMKTCGSHIKIVRIQ